MATVIDHARAAITGDDAQRLAARRAVRSALATIAMNERRIDELAERIAELDRRADQAADLHLSTTQPLQAAIAVLEDRIKLAITERQPVHPGDEDERRDLLAKIGDANEVLEREVQLIDGLKKPLVAEWEKLRGEYAGKRTVLENQLAGEELGNPQLLDQLHLARAQQTWSKNWREHADKKVLEYQTITDNALRREGKYGAVRDPMLGEIRLEFDDPREAIQRRLRRWRLESARARDLWAEAGREINRLRQELVDE